MIRVIKITIVGMDLHDVAVVAEPEPIRSALSDELRVGQAVGNHDKAAFGKGDATHTSAFHVHRRCQLGRWETPGWHTGLQSSVAMRGDRVVLGTLCLHIAASSAPQFGTRRSPMILPDPPLSLILDLGIAPSAVRVRVVPPSVVPSATIPADGTSILGSRNVLDV